MRSENFIRLATVPPKLQCLYTQEAEKGNRSSERSSDKTRCLCAYAPGEAMGSVVSHFIEYENIMKIYIL